MTVMGMPRRGRRLAILAMTAGAAAVLGGCSPQIQDVGFANYVLGERRTDPPSPIQAMAGKETAYPNLGTVPPRPKNLTTQAQRDAQMTALEDHRARNRLAADALEEKAQTLPPPLPAQTLPEPMAVPPPPRIKEGG